MRLFARCVLAALALCAVPLAAEERPALDTYAPARPFAEALWRPAETVTAPAAALDRPDGAAETLAGPAVAVFWATWCPVCREEMPRVAALAERLADGPVRLIPIAVDVGPAAAETVRRHLDAEGLWRLPALVDRDHTAAEALGLRGVPSAVFIDAEGRMRGMIEGRARWDEPALLAYAESLAASGPAD